MRKAVDMTKVRSIDPQQALAKDAIRAWLDRRPYKRLTDISAETCIPLSSLYYWINGNTLNFKNPAYVQAVAKWVEAHDHE